MAENDLKTEEAAAADSDLNQTDSVEKKEEAMMPDEMMPPKDEEDEKKKMPEMPELYSINTVEIFKTGVHNEEEYTREDLEEMAVNFEKMRAENPDFSLPIKIGHKQDLKDGCPAAGWMKNIRQVGDKLFADFVDLPEEVFKFIKLNGLKNRSIEFIENFQTSTGEKVGKMLTAVALLGMTMPAVNLLEAGKFLYGSNFSENQNLKIITFSENEIKKEEKKGGGTEMEKALEKIKEFASNPEKIVEILTGYEAKTKEFEIKLQEMSAKENLRKNTELKQFANDLVSQGKIIPAEKYLVETLLSNLDDEKEIEYHFSEFGVKKSETILKIFQNFLNSLPDRGLFKTESTIDNTADHNAFMDHVAKKVFSLGSDWRSDMASYKQVMSRAMSLKPELFEKGGN